MNLFFVRLYIRHRRVVAVPTNGDPYAFAYLNKTKAPWQWVTLIAVACASITSFALVRAYESSGKQASLEVLEMVAASGVLSLIGTKVLKDISESGAPNDKERLPLLTRVSKAAPYREEDLIDLCWYIDPKLFNKMLLMQGDEPRAYEERMRSLCGTVERSQEMLETLYDKNGLTVAQIETMNQWGPAASRADKLVLRPKGDLLSSDAIVPLDQITATYLAEEADRAVMQMMLTSISNIRTGKMRLGKCESCHVIFPVAREGQSFCSHRCGARVRKQRQRAAEQKNS